MNKKKIVYIDMDGVLVDLKSNFDKWFDTHPHLVDKFKKCPDHIPGIFRDPLPYEDAIEAVQKLYDSDKYELFIATSSPWGNPDASTENSKPVPPAFADNTLPATISGNVRLNEEEEVVLTLGDNFKSLSSC